MELASFQVALSALEAMGAWVMVVVEWSVYWSSGVCGVEGGAYIESDKKGTVGPSYSQGSMSVKYPILASKSPGPIRWPSPTLPPWGKK